VKKRKEGTKKDKIKEENREKKLTTERKKVCCMYSERCGYIFTCVANLAQRMNAMGDPVTAGWIPHSPRSVLVLITSCPLSWFIVFSPTALVTQLYGCTFRRLPGPAQWRTQAFLTYEHQ
jgi:hypothetical protein